MRGTDSESAAKRSILGLVRLFLGSSTGSPELVSLFTTSSTVKEGSASIIEATAPAIWGAAWDVPDIAIFADCIIDPGASKVRKSALFEKQVT